MTTNREWLFGLDDRTLAEFLTHGIMVRMVDFHTDAFPLRIHDISMRYTASSYGVEKWLSDKQQYELAKGGE